MNQLAENLIYSTKKNRWLKNKFLIEEEPNRETSNASMLVPEIPRIKLFK